MPKEEGNGRVEEGLHQSTADRVQKEEEEKTILRFLNFL